MMTVREALEANPLIAILRGLEPDRAVPVAEVLFEAGFRIIEVPLNSPAPLESIERLAKRLGQDAIVGAGTVLRLDEVEAVKRAGGRIIVSPNMNPVLGRAAVERGLIWCPGVLTPTEAFTALDHGAEVLKFFPAELVTPAAIGAMRAVLPKDAIVAAVGGIDLDSLAAYRRAGTNAFGLGSSLFKPAYSIAEIDRRARQFVDAWSGLKDQD